MASLVPNLRKTLYAARSIAGQLGFRPHRVFFNTAYTSGEVPGDGGRIDTLVELTEAHGQSPKVRWLKDEQRALAQLPTGTVEIGPITPEFPGGGTSLDKISAAKLDAGIYYMLRIVGPQHPDGADYRITETTVDRSLRYMIRAIPAGTQWP